MTKTSWCPVCRGEIHAIAGRCKHCKADLVDIRERASRAARAQAMGAVVPPLPRPPMMAAVQVTPPTAAAPPPQPPPPPVMEGAATWVDSPPPAGTPPRGTPEVAPPQTADTWPQPYQAGPPPHARSSWSRRWPLLVSAVALLAIGISIGMLAERWRHGQADSGDGRMKSASTRPHQVPDHMPLPLLPGPGAPRQIDPDPDQTSPGMPTAPMPSPSNPGSRFGGGSSDPGVGGDASAFRTFTTSLTES